jgi:hypothetical protein
MRLVDGVGILVAELVDNLLDAVEIGGGEGLADEALELQGPTLALVVQLVIEGLGDVGVHGTGG